MDLPKLIAHRGYSSRYPENTLLSIEAAFNVGATYIEFDLQMMADNEFILMHDANLQRSSGVNKSVFSLTRQTVKNFQANYDSLFPGHFSGIKIPLLENALSLIKQYPEATVLVEVKEESIEEFGAEVVMQKLLPILKEIKDRCYIISFSDSVIEYVKSHSDFLCGYVLHKYSETFRENAARLKPDLLICNYRKLPELDADGILPADALWPGDWQWALYLIDNAELALNYARNGVTFIETNHIELLLQNKQFNSQIVKHSTDHNA